MWAVGVAAILLPWWAPNTPWAKQALARQVTARTGLECRLGPIIPLSWDGLAHLHGVRLHRPGQTAPLVELPHVTAAIRWSALGRGRLEIAALRLHGGWLNWTPPPARPAADADPAAPTDDPSAGAEASGLAESMPPGPPPADTVIPAGVGLLGAAAPTSPAAPAAEPLSSPALAAANPPALPPAAETASNPVSRPFPAPADAASPAPAVTPPASPAPSPPAARPLHRTGSVDRVTLSEFRIRWKATTGSPRPDILAATLDLDIPLGGAAVPDQPAGHLEATQLELAGRPWPSPVRLPVFWDGRTLRLRDAEAPVPGGVVRISAALVPGAPGWPLTGAATARQLAVGDAIAWLLPTAAPATGTADAELHFAVPARRPGRLRTVGQIEVTQLVLPAAAWLELAGLPELAARWPKPSWPVQRAHARFESTGPSLTLEDATLAADDLTVRALGTASADGPSIAVRTYVQPGGADLITRLSEGWPPERQLLPQLLPNSPWAFLDVTVGGTWAAPELGLWNRFWRLPDLRSEIRRLQQPVPPS